ncbi:MAG: MlaD family protein [Gordonia sp. (in: high G+C Gram-positive bacteria)]|uniref:MlaD family protein n=1 Tax=Gordonia sp. (in: high G+C Gram-positive bacteria) TaxID=84139 RepID=UPI003BB596FE
MQPLTKTAQAVRGFYGRLGESNLALGGTALVSAVVLLVVLGFVYLRPLGQQTIRFETDDAAAVSTGEDVRVAGIGVGKVTSMSLGAESVVIEAEIDDEVFVGDQSRIEVRMRTPVGGYAVNLIPLGDRRAEDGRIATDRVSVPYSINDVLQRVPGVTDEVDSTVIESNLDEVAEGLDRQPDSLRSIVKGMGSVAEVLDRQRGQIDRIASMSQEYLQTFNANRAFVFELIKKIDIVISTYNNNSVGFNETYRLMSNALWRLQPLEKFYLENADAAHAHVENIRDAVEGIQRDMGPALDNLLALRDQLARWVTPEGMRTLGGGVIDMSRLCVPLAGRDC